MCSLSARLDRRNPHSATAIATAGETSASSADAAIGAGYSPDRRPHGHEQTGTAALGQTGTVPRAAAAAIVTEPAIHPLNLTKRTRRHRSPNHRDEANLGQTSDSDACRLWRVGRGPSASAQRPDTPRPPAARVQSSCWQAGGGELGPAGPRSASRQADPIGGDTGRNQPGRRPVTTSDSRRSKVAPPVRVDDLDPWADEGSGLVLPNEVDEPRRPTQRADAYDELALARLAGHLGARRDLAQCGVLLGREQPGWRRPPGQECSGRSLARERLPGFRERSGDPSLCAANPPELADRSATQCSCR